MKTDGFNSGHYRDENGNPNGGLSYGTGFTIKWDSMRAPRQNGAFVENVLGAVIDRIEFYQSTGFKCVENAEALEYLRKAATCLAVEVKHKHVEHEVQKEHDVQ